MSFVGVDVVSVERVNALVARRPAFARRAFTEREVAAATALAPRWATRWAAKEAVRKLAGAAGVALPAYRDIEVVIDSSGAPHAEVAHWLEPIAISLTHEGDTAMAVAVSEDVPLVASGEHLALPNRGPGSYKGTFGRVTVIAGSRGFAGAAYLAASGAARAGAGLVTAVVPEAAEHVVVINAPSIMVHPQRGDHDRLSPAAIDDLVTAHLTTADAVVVGCGLGRDDVTRDALLALLPRITVPTVLDADALTLLGINKFDWKTLRQPVVVTPHPGEMATLIGSTTAEVQADRRRVATDFAASSGVVVILKGAHTIVADPDGRVYEDDHDVVALATGGTGDVLAGVTSGFLAQHCTPFDAAVNAVVVHATAGAMVQARLGRAGSLATDVLDFLPAAQEALRRHAERHR